MSNLTQFAPFASGGLKSFQTGYVSTTSSTYSSGEDQVYLDVTVSAVATAKTVTGFSGSWSGYASSAGQIYSAYSQTGFATTRMTSTTNLRIGEAQYTGTNIKGRWQAAEAN